MGFRRQHYPTRKTTGYLFCLNCFQESPVTVYPSRCDFIDGLPMISVAQQMEQYTICDCGIFLDKERAWLDCSKHIESSEYQNALRMQDSVEQKLAIMELSGSSKMYIALLRLHYAHENNQPTNELIQHCLTLQTQPIYSGHYTVRLPHIIQSSRHVIYLSDKYRTIDLLRQGQQWDQALQLIESELQQNPRTNQRSVLQYEMDAMQNRVSKPI